MLITDKRLVSSTTAADMLGISVEMVYYYKRQGKLKPWRCLALSKRLFFLRDDVLRLRYTLARRRWSA